jgi:hypothetical protein
MAQTVGRRPLAAEARYRSRVNPYVICGGQSDTRTGFAPCHFHSTGAPLPGKTSPSQGCTISLKAAVCP